MKAIYVTLISALLPPLLAAGAAPNTARMPVMSAPQAEWTDDTFAADVYPSQRMAAQSVGRKWAQQLEVAVEPPKAIRVFATPEIAPATREAFKAAIEAALPETQCLLQSTTPQTLPTAGPREVLVSLGEVPQGIRAVTGSSPSMIQKSLRLQEPGRSALLASSLYIDKPWADEAVTANDPSFQEQHLVVRSAKPAATQGEAYQQAMTSAAARILERIRPTLLDKRPGYAAVDEQWVLQRLTHDVQQGKLIRDVFVQKFDRPYGAIYREALLLQISPDDLNRLASQTRTGIYARQQASRNSILSLAGLFAVVFLLYLLLNSVTRGYFRGRLFAMALVLAIVGVMVLVRLVP